MDCQNIIVSGNHTSANSGRGDGQEASTLEESCEEQLINARLREDDYRCYQCDKSFPTLRRLRNHVNREENCSWLSSLLEKLAKKREPKVQERDRKKAMRTCKGCGVSFQNKARILAHGKKAKSTRCKRTAAELEQWCLEYDGSVLQKEKDSTGQKHREKFYRSA